MHVEEMKMNTSDANNLDADALLPPRKRLLAGLKRQSPDSNIPIPSTSSSNAGIEFDARLNQLLRSHLSDPNISNEEVVEASRSAAIEAAKIAVAARANAEDKAAKAAKAVAAAKSALELVATLSEEAAKKERRLKKNKLKKQIPVQALYNKNKGKTNCRTDEELARNLHRVINSSPRILKNSSSSDVKIHKRKRLKSSPSSEKTNIYSGGPVGEGNLTSIATSDGNGILEEVDSEGPIKELDTVTVNLNTSKPDKVGQLRLDYGGEQVHSKTDQTMMEYGEVVALHFKDKSADSSDCHGKKRGRIKQKKLPLSICSFRDQTDPKELRKPKGMPQLKNSPSGHAVSNQPWFPNSLVPVERTSLWKCQAFKAPTCVKQNKVMQS